MKEPQFSEKFVKKGGVKMRKMLWEFVNNEESARLKISACALSKEDFIEIKGRLEKIKGLHFDIIDADSITATITGDYDYINTLRKQLESEGWEWE